MGIKLTLRKTLEVVKTIWASRGLGEGERTRWGSALPLHAFPG